jgi:SAM-dependent methyltransferase
MNANGQINTEASEPWERFAEADPYLYILTSLKRRDRGTFWESGEKIVQMEFLPLLRTHRVRRLLGLEVGCGIGRLILPVARRFQEAVGIDVAPGMVRRAVSFAGENGIKNASFIPASGPQDLLQSSGKYVGRCDFIYSLLVFQHIPEFSVIEGYLHAIGVLLHRCGLAYVQFDTRPKSISYRLKTRLPDFLLPRFWRRGIRRIRRSPKEIETCIRRAGMEIVAELTPHTAYHRYVLRRSQCDSESK